MKMVNMNKRNSDSYIGSADTSCAADMLQIEEIRSFVKTMNKQLKHAKAVDRFGHPLRYRVSLKGREPVEKQVIPAYSWHKEKWENRSRSYDNFGDIVGGISNAKRIDVYIHRRMDY